MNWIPELQEFHTQERSHYKYERAYATVLKYECDTRTLSDRDKSRLEVSEMRYLRAAIGVTKIDKIKVSIWNDRKEITDAVWTNDAKEGQQESESYLENRSRYEKEKVKPNWNWNGEIAKTLQLKEINWRQAEMFARNRQGWRTVRYKRNLILDVVSINTSLTMRIVLLWILLVSGTVCRRSRTLSWNRVRESRRFLFPTVFFIGYFLDYTSGWCIGIQKVLSWSLLV